MIYFTSDLHAFHKNILRLDDLPFRELYDYREYIISVWNSRIQPEDEVYILGDVAVGGTNKAIYDFLNRLNGNKYLIQGNHDSRNIMKSAYVRDCFKWIKYHHVLEYDKTRIHLYHCPIESWFNKDAGGIHLHGHSHGKSQNVKNRMDVGFKACDFNIHSIEEIIKILKERL